MGVAKTDGGSLFTPFRMPVDVFLPPGTGYMVEQTVTNVELLTGWYWRERSLTPNE